MCFELLLFLDGQLLTGCDENDVAVLAHVEALGLHDDVQRLIPRDVLESQGEAPSDGITGDDVETGEVGDDLQHRSHFDILEIERKLLPLVSRSGPLRELVGVFLDGLYFDDEAVIRLVRRVLPQAPRFDDDARIAALGKGIDGSYRRREIGHIESALEAPLPWKPDCCPLSLPAMFTRSTSTPGIVRSTAQGSREFGI